MGATTVTIAVVSWNTRDLLARALRSLQPDVDAGLAEVWVVDNASSDGSADLVRDEFPSATLVANPENAGFGSAVNQVAAETSSEWLACANADVALRPGALAELIACGERNPRAGALAPRLVLPDGSTQHSVFAFPEIGTSLVLATGAYRLVPGLADRLALPGHWDSGRARPVPWAVAAFLLFRRAAWDEAGGFDERQWMYAEDLDLGWRLRRAGWTTRYEPGAVADHEHGAATAQYFGSWVDPHTQRATYGFLARRRGAAYTWVVALTNAFGAGVRWLGASARALTGSEPGARMRGTYGRWVRLHLAALRSRRELIELR